MPDCMYAYMYVVDKLLDFCACFFVFFFLVLCGHGDLNENEKKHASTCIYTSVFLEMKKYQALFIFLTFPK